MLSSSQPRVVQVPLKEGGFDLEGILQSIDDHTALVWLCNPNNPTGTYFDQETLNDFLERVPSHIPVLIDEAYVEFVTAPDFPNTLELQETFENAFYCAFSKSLWLGWIKSRLRSCFF